MRFLMLLACNHASDSPAAWVDTATLGAPETVPPPTWTAEEVQSRLQSTLADGLPDAPQVLVGFQQMFTDGADPWDGSGSSGCPNTGNYTMTQSFAGCVSQKGYIFAGISTFSPSTDGSAGFFLLGDCYISDPEGNTFYCGGEIEYTEDHSANIFAARLTGTWGSVTAESWLSNVPSLALWEHYSAGELTLDGGYGPQENDLYFEHTSSSDSCANAGALWLRDPGGSWYVLDYGEDCDDCGDLSYAGTAFGTACADFNAAGASLRQNLGFP